MIARYQTIVVEHFLNTCEHAAIIFESSVTIAKCSAIIAEANLSLMSAHQSLLRLIIIAECSSVIAEHSLMSAAVIFFVECSLVILISKKFQSAS